MLDWELLKFVRAVSVSGHTSHAAKLLGVSQQTVERQIERAQTCLDVALFSVVDGRFIATEAGMLLAERAEVLHNALSETRVAPPDPDTKVSGTLRISFPTNLLPYTFSEQIASFSHSNPDVVFDVVATDEVVDADSIDVVVRAGQDYEDNLTGFLLFDIFHGYFASSEFLRTVESDYGSVADMPSVPIVLRHNMRPWVMEDLNELWPNHKVVAQAADIESMVALGKAGMGIVMLPFFLANRVEDLLPVAQSPHEEIRHLWVLCPKSKADDPIVSRFMRYLKFHMHQQAHRYIQ